MNEQPAWWREIDPRTTAFFLDVDGTLLGFKERPEDVVADAELLDLLRALRRKADDAVALVSGRLISDLDRIVAPLVLPAGGVHGAELRFADGRREAAAGTATTEVREAAARFVAERPGLRLEDKGGVAIALHYRQAPERADELRAFLDGAVTDSGLTIQHGKMVAEVKPAGVHKGKAIEALLATQPFEGRLPLFMGDDLTDEYGFETVGELGGIAIKVGGMDEATCAQFRLADTSAVRNLLVCICD